MSGIHQCLIMSPHCTLLDKRSLSYHLLYGTRDGVHQTSTVKVLWHQVVLMLCVTSYLLCPRVPGLHHGHVLPPDVDWRAAEVRGTNWNPAAQQPHGGEDLGTGHVLPELEEVHFSQHDDAQQAVPYYAERDRPLHHEVTSHATVSLRLPEGEDPDVFLFLLVLLPPGWPSVQTAQWIWLTFPWTATPALCASEAVSGIDAVFKLRDLLACYIWRVLMRFIWDDVFFFFLDAYTSSEIKYTWRKGVVDSVDCPKESMSLLQYDLVGQTLSSEIFRSNTGNGQKQMKAAANC